MFYPCLLYYLRGPEVELQILNHVISAYDLGIFNLFSLSFLEVYLLSCGVNRICLRAVRNAIWSC